MEAVLVGADRIVANGTEPAVTVADGPAVANPAPGLPSGWCSSCCHVAILPWGGAEGHSIARASAQVVIDRARNRSLRRYCFELSVRPSLRWMTSSERVSSRSRPIQLRPRWSGTSRQNGESDSPV
jgi:hypothetical protein